MCGISLSPQGATSYRQRNQGPRSPPPPPPDFKICFHLDPPSPPKISTPEIIIISNQLWLEMICFKMIILKQLLKCNFHEIVLLEVETFLCVHIYTHGMNYTQSQVSHFISPPPPPPGCHVSPPLYDMLIVQC